MAYLEISDFKAGLDTRRMEETSQPGTLAVFTNGHLTRGAEVEKSLAWVERFSLPAGTKGLSVRSNKVIVFGTVDPASIAIPAGVTYLRLSPSTGGNIVSVNSYDLFDNRIYLSATMDTGDTYHFYEGTDGIMAVVNTNPDNLTGLTPGKFVRALKKKMFSTSGALVQFSAVNAPTIYVDDEDNVGSGFINLGNQDIGSVELNAIAKYSQNAVVFGRRSTQIWFFDTDPSQDQQLQVLANTGAISPRSVVEFGDIDVFYLSTSGIRSIKARDSSNAAFSSDIGTAIDEEIVNIIRSEVAKAESAVAVLEPFDGRYMLAIGSEIYVFSYFPSSKISAWSKYEAPANVDEMAVDDERLYLRCGDKVYQLGGEDFQTYDDTALVIATPFLDAETPSTLKNFTEIEFAAEGTFDVEVAVDPTQPDVYTPVATGFVNTTFRHAKIPLTQSGKHIKVRITSTNDGYARIGKIIIHFTPT